MPPLMRIPEFVCDRLVRAEFRQGRLALIFEAVTIIVSIECALFLVQTIGDTLGDEG